ncbi:MAG TPA: DNA polymerase III subunit gamma/tau [Acidimicrobiia bacterium]|nr:DNA polymerase III subunit gamma/tau [Acidimicrobiia bacterium]
MSFQSLYRKHRPQRFADVIGQEHVTSALLNAVREDRVGHAYLFSGPRGTGKTTTARLLAMALNCTNPEADGEPCGVCDSCAEIARARESATVMERDAASAGGVDEMRDLLRSVDLSVPGKRKVYILDEVHMLTKGASNALLKTLEEPLPHVVFVLATTEPEKVLPTIRSRTQHFQFQLLPVERLVELLGDIAKREGVDTDEETLRIIARRGAGSGRDALTLLDQALAVGNGALDADTISTLFEATPFDRRAGIVEALGADDAALVLSALADLLEEGTDPRQIADDLLRHLRDVFVAAASRGKARLDHVSDDERTALEEQGRALGYERVVRAIETLGAAVVDMRRAPDPRLILEVALVRLARRETGSSIDVLTDRIDRLERALDELRGGGTPAGASAPSLPAPARTKKTPAAAPAPASSPAAVDGGPDADAVVDAAAPEPKPPSARPALGAVRGTNKTPTPTAPAASRPAKPTPSAPAPEASLESSPAAASDAVALDLDDVVLAWPKALEGMKGMLKAVATEAQPVAVDGATIVLGLPTPIEHQRGRLEQAVDEVGSLLGAAMGLGPLRVRVEMHQGFLGTAASPSTPARENLPEDDEVPDVVGDDAEAPDAAAEPRLDSVDRLVSAFDAVVEDESETP